MRKSHFNTTQLGNTFKRGNTQAKNSAIEGSQLSGIPAASGKTRHV